MKLIKGSDLLAAFGALHDIGAIVRSNDPAVVGETAGAIRDALANAAPVGASLADCLNDEDLMRFTAREAIKAYSAQAGEAGTAETTEIGSVHEHAVGEADAPKGGA